MYIFFCGFFSALQIKSLPVFLLFQNREQIATDLLKCQVINGIRSKRWTYDLLRDGSIENDTFPE